MRLRPHGLLTRWTFGLVLLLLLGCGARENATPARRTLRILLGTAPPSLDPHLSFSDVSSVIVSNVYEKLVDLDGQAKLRPHLALRWFSPDEGVWRFELNPAARFSDGSPVEADDVVFSLQRARTLEGSEMAGLVRFISSVEAVDAHTVNVRTERPVGVLTSLALVPIVSRRSGAAGAAPLGSGPYRIVDTPADDTIRLEANPHHAPAPPAHDVEITVSPGAAFVDTARARPPHVGFYFRLDVQEELDRAPPAGTRLLSNQGLFVTYLAFNVRPQLADGSPNPVVDARVRRALALATDREALIHEAVRLARPASQLVTRHVFGFDPALELPATDVNAARALLAEAGHPALEVTLDAPQGGSLRTEKALAAQWEAAGIGVRVRVRDDDRFGTAGKGVESQLQLAGWGCTAGDAGELIASLLETGGDFNVAGFSNPEMDRLALQNLLELDVQRRQELLRRALRLANQELPYLPLMTDDDVYLVADGVRFTPRFDGELRLEEIGPVD